MTDPNTVFFERIALALETLASGGKLLTPPHDYANGRSENLDTLVTLPVRLVPPANMRLEAVHVSYQLSYIDPSPGEWLRIDLARVGTIDLARGVTVPQHGLSLHGRFLVVHPAVGCDLRLTNIAACSMVVHVKCFWKSVPEHLLFDSYL